MAKSDLDPAAMTPFEVDPSARAHGSIRDSYKLTHLRLSEFGSDARLGEAASTGHDSLVSELG